MDVEFYEKLKQSFPFVQCFPECGDGWNQLIWDMCKEIDMYYTGVYGTNWTLLDDEDSFKLMQIKEKFGELRVYHYVWDSNIDDIIEKYTKLSQNTCEICGRDGEMVNNMGWITIRCEKCFPLVD